MSRELLTDFMVQAPGQPATNFWRAAEVQEVVRYGLPSGRGLDLGCGDGHLMAIILARLGSRDLVGLDLDPQEVEIARFRQIYKEVVSAPGDRTPFPDADFDYVFSNSVLEHIENIDAVLAEIRRVLRPGGRFIFTVPGPNFHKCLKGPVFGSRAAYLHALDQRCAHLRYWSSTEWSAHLSQAGLLLVHAQEYLNEAQVRRWEFIARWTSGVLYSLVRRKRQPIDIQRVLRIRSERFRLPQFAGALLAGIMASNAHADNACFGCLLIEARKP